MNERYRKLRLPASVLAASIAISACGPQEQQPTAIEHNQPTPSQTHIDGEATLFPEVQNLEEVKAVVESFSWEDFDDDAKLKEFINTLAGGYFLLTQTDNQVLTSMKPEDISFHRDYEEFRDMARELTPGFQTFENLIAVSVPDRNKQKLHYLINIEGAEAEFDREKHHPGYYLMNTMWHLWSSLDAVPNERQGELLNNPEFGIGQNFEQARGYRGGSIYSDNDIDFIGFDFFLSHAVITRLAGEKMNIDLKDKSDGYGAILEDFMFFETGDIIKKSEDSGISPEKFYELYETSQLEEIYEVLGQHYKVRRLDVKGLRARGINVNKYKGYLFALALETVFREYSNMLEQDYSIPNNAAQA